MDDRTDYTGRPSRGGDEQQLPANIGRRVALLLVGAFLLGMAMAAFALWATGGYLGDEPIGSTPLVAAILGGGAAMALAAGLMAAIFYSSRSGWDERTK